MARFDPNTGQWVDDSLSMFGANAPSAQNSFNTAFGDNMANSAYGNQMPSVGIDVNPMGNTPPATTGSMGMFGGDSGGGFFDNALGEEGWVNPAISGASALANSWLGFEELGVAKDQYKLEKEQYDYNKSNYDAALERKAAALAHS